MQQNLTFSRIFPMRGLKNIPGIKNFALSVRVYEKDLSATYSTGGPCSLGRNWDDLSKLFEELLLPRLSAIIEEHKLIPSLFSDVNT